MGLYSFPHRHPATQGLSPNPGPGSVVCALGEGPGSSVTPFLPRVLHSQPRGWFVAPWVQRRPAPQGPPDFFTAIVVPLLKKGTTCLSVIGAYLRGASPLGRAVMRGYTPLLSPWARAFPTLTFLESLHCCLNPPCSWLPAQVLLCLLLKGASSKKPSMMGCSSAASAGWVPQPCAVCFLCVVMFN